MRRVYTHSFLLCSHLPVSPLHRNAAQRSVKFITSKIQIHISFFSLIDFGNKIKQIVWMHMLKVIGRVMKCPARRTAAAEWTTGLLRSEFFRPCGDHADRRRNERNVFCMDCNAGICKHCLSSPAHPARHRWLQICKYVYQDVVRLHDIQKHLDCSRIQTYKINGEKAVHIKPRPRSKKESGNKTKVGFGGGCDACGRHLQEFPNRFCSIACKVSDGTNRDKIISVQISHFGEEDSSTKENTENESCTSLLTESSEVIQVWVTASALKPKKPLHKRKGVPCRAPFC